MSRSDRSNVVVAHASRPPPDGLAVASLRSRELKMESSCRRAETRRSSLFCAVRLAMPLAKLSDRPEAQKRILLTRQSLRSFVASRGSFTEDSEGNKGRKRLENLALSSLPSVYVSFL